MVFSAAGIDVGRLFDVPLADDNDGLDVLKPETIFPEWNPTLLENAGNGTALFKKCKNCFNTNIYSYLETSAGQSSNPYLNVVILNNLGLGVGERMNVN